jgi:hypothetical protein
MGEAVDLLAERLIRLQGDGDYTAVSAFLDRYVAIDSELEADLRRLSAADIPVDVVFEQGMEHLD